MKHLLVLLLAVGMLFPSAALAYSDPFEEMFQQAFEQGQLPESLYIEPDGTVSDAASLFREADTAVFGAEETTPKPEPEPEPESTAVNPVTDVLGESTVAVPENLSLSGEGLRTDYFIKDIENDLQASFTLINAAKFAVGPLMVKHKFYDDELGRYRLVKRKMNFIDARDEVEIPIVFPASIKGSVDVFVAIDGRTYVSRSSAFVYPGQIPSSVADDDVLFEEGDPIVVLMEEEAEQQLFGENNLDERIYHLSGNLLEQARNLLRSQSYFYLEVLHDDELDELTNIFAMFDLLGDEAARYYPDGKVDQPQDVSTGVARHKQMGDYDYFRFPSYTAANLTTFMDFMRLLRQRGSQGVILDLRGNNSGTNYQAVDSLEPFLDPSEPILYIESRGGRQAIESYNQPMIKDIPMMVLIDGNTGKAAEVLASGLKEYGMAQTIGEPSAGDTVLMNRSELVDGSVIVMTYARWYTGKYGRDLSESGLDVNHAVVDDPDTPDDESIMKAIDLFDKMPKDEFQMR